MRWRQRTPSHPAPPRTPRTPPAHPPHTPRCCPLPPCPLAPAPALPRRRQTRRPPPRREGVHSAHAARPRSRWRPPPLPLPLRSSRRMPSRTAPPTAGSRRPKGWGASAMVKKKGGRDINPADAHRCAAATGPARAATPCAPPTAALHMHAPPSPRHPAARRSAPRKLRATRRSASCSVPPSSSGRLPAACRLRQLARQPAARPHRLLPRATPRHVRGATQG